MDDRVLVGIPTQTLQAIDGVPEGVPHSWVMSSRYFEAVTQAGAVPVMVPLLTDESVLRGVFERLDGLFLAGGVDIHPTVYGEAKRDATGNTDADRDTVELLLARWAIEERMPVLGVCRGHQVVNVATGGTLYQDTSERAGSIKHDYFPTQGFERDHLAHAVQLSPGSQLAAAYGGATSAAVNSMHHQGIRVLGEGLRATAIAPDGLIEAIEGTEDGWLVAVQWHPEALHDAGTRALFDAFVSACAVPRAEPRLSRSA